MNRHIVTVLMIILLGGAVTACGSSDERYVSNGNTGNSRLTNTVLSSSVADVDAEETLAVPYEVETYQDRKWQHLSNGGYIAENENYIYFADGLSNLIQYTKLEDSFVQIKLELVGDYPQDASSNYSALNIDEDGCMYMVSGQNSNYVIKADPVSHKADVVFTIRDIMCQCFPDIEYYNYDDEYYHVNTLALVDNRLFVHVQNVNHNYVISADCSGSDMQVIRQEDASDDSAYGSGSDLIYLTEDNCLLYGDTDFGSPIVKRSMDTGEEQLIRIIPKDTIGNLTYAFQDNKIYTFDSDETPVYYCYDIASDEYTQLEYTTENADLIGHYGMHSMFAHNGQLFAAGYCCICGFSEDIKAFDAGWTLRETGESRHDHILGFAGDSFWSVSDWTIERIKLTYNADFGEYNAECSVIHEKDIDKQ